MKPARASILAVLGLHAAMAGAQSQTSSGAQSPAIGHMGQGTINYNNNYQIIRPVSPKLSSLDKKREALLMAENPTVLEIAGIGWTTWFGDSEPYLTVRLSNKSKLPALNIRVEALDGATGGTIGALKPYSFPKSYTMKILGDQKINVSGGAAWEWPLAPLHRIQAVVGSECITGGGLGFDHSPSDYAGSRDLPSGIQLASDHKAIYLRLSYETIFEEKVSYAKSVVIDSAPRSQTHFRERGTGRIVPLKCVGSAPGFTIG